jgi:hypothetical protein
MMLPIVNPRRPPKAWFRHAVASIRRRSPGIKDPAAVAAWNWYHHVGKGRKLSILKEEKALTGSRHTGKSSHLIERGAIMARRHRRTRHIRHNARRRGVRHFSGGHRPRLYSSGGSWYRSPHSRLIAAGTVLNPHHFGRLHHRRRHHARYNPSVKGAIGSMKNALSKHSIMTGLTIAGGLAGGFASKSLGQSAFSALKLPASSQKFVGAFNVVVGALMIGMVKNRVAKEIGAIIAGVGIYDIISQNTPVGLPLIPAWDVAKGILPATTTTVKGSYAGPRISVSSGARMSGSYPAMVPHRGPLMGDLPTMTDSPYADLM